MTTVLGIFGDPVKHSKSPRMWNAAIEHLGLDARYLPFHVRRGTVGDALVGMRALGIRGVNVTLPHKEDVIPHLDVVDDAARSIGAVNTVRLEDGRLEGFNTDAPGLVRSLLEGHAGQRRRGLIEDELFRVRTAFNGVAVYARPSKVNELVVFLQERQLHRSGRAITLFGNDDFDDIFVLGFLVVIVIAIEKGNDVRILLDGT